MKNFYTIIMIALMPAAGTAQIGVGTTSLDATAMLQVNASASTNAKGFLGPRVALTSTSANSPFSVTPATGLMVYNTATAGSGVSAVTPGYYSYTGSGWERLAAPPTTFVYGTAGGFPSTPIEWMEFGSISRPSIGSIDLPPGRWEVIAEYTCVPSDNYQNGGLTMKNRENTYWLSTFLGGGNHSGFSTSSYPLPLSSLSDGAVTSDALFTGSAIVLQRVATLVDGKIQFFPNQSMKFYINNTSASSKTYYLYFHESIIDGANPANGDSYAYRVTSGENRLYAVKIN